MNKRIILIFLYLSFQAGCTHPGLEPLSPHVKKDHAGIAQPQDAASLQTLQPPLVVQAIDQEWSTRPGLLRAQMEDWATSAGYQIVWRVSRDYHLQSSFHFSGTYVEALQAFFDGMQKMGNSLKVTVYQGNNVVLISEE
jgi:hypothetical protein